jgi:hypothetical protein
MQSVIYVGVLILLDFHNLKLLQCSGDCRVIHSDSHCTCIISEPCYTVVWIMR